MKIIKRLPGLPVERALGVLSGRWKAVILYVLMDGPQRTCEVEKRIVGISQKVLIEQLRALEEHGMVSRQPSTGDNQGIEYLLTPLGESLRPVLDSLLEWGAHHAKELDEVHRLLPCGAVVRDRTVPKVQAHSELGETKSPRGVRTGVSLSRTRRPHHVIGKGRH
jgi:DNA-binding HxlR family transcriptional regulator